MKERIGFIGLGTMGLPMAERLWKAGYDLVLYNRTPQKVESMMRRGALRVHSPRDVAEASAITITMVSDDQALTDIVIGQNGLYMGLGREKIHIDMSTISPKLARKLERLYHNKEASFLHAPVLGSKPQATEGTLLIFVGGDQAAFERCRPLFDVLGERIWYFSDVTQATHLKLTCNQFIASMMTALAQGLVFAQKAGLSAETIIDVLGASALNAPMYRSKTRKILERSFSEANFFVTHMLKDLDLMLEAGRHLHAPLPGVAAIRELFVAAQAQGYDREDYSAVIKVLEHLAGTQVRREQPAS